MFPFYGNLRENGKKKVFFLFGDMANESEFLSSERENIGGDGRSRKNSLIKKCEIWAFISQKKLKEKEASGG